MKTLTSNKWLKYKFFVFIPAIYIGYLHNNSFQISFQRQLICISHFCSYQFENSKSKKHKFICKGHCLYTCTYDNNQCYTIESFHSYPIQMYVDMTHFSWKLGLFLKSIVVCCQKYKYKFCQKKKILHSYWCSEISNL